MIHLRIELGNNIEVVASRVILKLYQAVSGNDFLSGSLIGNILAEHATEKAYAYLTGNDENNQKRFPDLTVNITGGLYMDFRDPIVGLICATTWGDGVGITQQQANIPTYVSEYLGLLPFKNNTQIEYFEELSKFSNILSKSEPEWWENYTTFGDCSNLKTIDLSNARSTNTGFCEHCISLLSIGSLSKMVFLGGNSFVGCSNLHIDVNAPMLQTLGARVFTDSGIVSVSNLGLITSIPNVDSSSNPSGYGPFRGCNSLVTMDLSTTSNLQIIYTGSILGSNSLRIIKLPASITTIDNYNFEHCPNIEAVVIYATTPPTINNTVFGGSTNNTFIVYVPTGYIQTYENDVNWSRFTGRFKEISLFAIDFPND